MKLTRDDLWSLEEYAERCCEWLMGFRVDGNWSKA